MAGRADASRELRLGLYALESGVIDDEQLLSAVRAWARSSDRALSQILVSRGLLAVETLALLEEQITRERESSRRPPPTAGELPTPYRLDRPSDLEPDVTVAYAGRSVDPDVGREAIGGPRFQVLRPHARGGLGEVFLAFDSELNRSVALKELQARRAHDPDSQARFLLEAEVTGRLEHPGIVPVYSLGRYADGRPYYAMRLIEGETLGAAIERLHRMGVSAARRDDRALAFRRLLRSVIDICNAVAYAHSRGVVHRDLKPDNIMLGPFGETLVVDWGVAKSSFTTANDSRAETSSTLVPTADLSMTQPGSVIGTPRYMSPEQAAGDLERVGPASDIYSLGAILYCLLVGHPPFGDGDLASVLDRVRRGIFPAPRRVLRSVDPTLEAVCLKAMALDPTERYASALDLANALEAWQADVRYRGEQEQALSQVKESLTRLCLERAHNSFGREAHAEGMLWLARALENAPSEPPELPRLIRTSLCAWHAGGKLMERALRHAGEVRAVAFCPEGRRLATGCADRSALLWDVSAGSPLASPLRHQGAVRAVAFHPDGASVATAGDDGQIRRWDAVTGGPLGASLRAGGPIAALSFSPDGSKLAVTGGAGRVLLWDLTTGLPIHESAKPAGRALAVAFAPDGETLAVAREDGSVRLLDVSTGRPTGASLDHGAAVPLIVFDPAGKMLLSVCLDGIVRLWDLSRRVTVVTLPHQGAVHAAGFRPDGDAFATACEDGTARLWETRTGRPIGEPLAHRARVTCLAFRPDGTMLATGSSDGTIRLWCAVSGLPIGPPLDQKGAVRILVFSQDGRRLAAGGFDVTVRCWNAPNPIEGLPERVSCWVRVTTELEFDSGDAIRRMDGPTSWECRRRLTDLGGPPLR
ncbi:WD40 repeat domain-containing serine/threonine protein kinase [Singulisphaera acidiphila]|uniref:WD40 repeat-containing protein n=1 Tax=Singulisphaera acidiphila (strain ATCC BAA-1392 / DSM 18658 / VKM B-2454 / MOB10) TaxID=886293 RepID=L0DDT4_SINAD|nr:protein kinase [Singulisphaera acidiphila]AGA27392.1 WD40 repeat-containing protein [Singulisphaera acidiphila DSM 18658]